MKHKHIAVAVVAGLLVAAAIAIAPPAQAKELGGVNVKGWCNAFMIAPQIAAPPAPLNPGNAYSWRCNYKDGRRGTGVDMNAACRWQYNNIKAWAKPLDSRNAYSWRCYV